MNFHPTGRRKTNLVLAAAVALSFSIFGAMQALGAALGPKAFVEQFSDSAISTLRDPSLEQRERQTELEQLLRQGFNLDRISKLVLGRHWRTANDQDRQAYSNLFERFVLTTYGRRLNAYSDQTIRVDSARPLKRGVMVATFIEGNGSPIRVDWRLQERDQSWQIVDLVVEGVSLVVTQRNEFAAIIEREGGQLKPLIEHLRAIVEKDDRPATT